MIPYASHFTGRACRAFLEKHGWHMMITPTLNRFVDPFPYAIDNGAWQAFAGGVPFDRIAFLSIVGARGAAADFIVIPDIVGGGVDSLEFSNAWMHELATYRNLYLAVQDGMTVASVRAFVMTWPQVAGLFVGGTTEWKDRTIPLWAEVARSIGIGCHVGRVNTKKRLRSCAAAGVTSFDGSGASRWMKHAIKMCAWQQQQSLILKEATGDTLTRPE